MKTTKLTLWHFSLPVAFFLFLFSNVAFSQVTQPDTSKIVAADTLKAVSSDSLKVIQAAPVVVPVETPASTPSETKAEPAVGQKDAEVKADDDKDKKKDKKGKKNEIILYSGVNFTKLGTSNAYETEAATGYQLGAYYKQGRMFYWQAGARFAGAKIGYKPADSPLGSEFESIPVTELDIPLTIGVNFTSFMNRVLSVRLFASAVPSFTLKVGDNPFGLTKDNVNSFVLYGQGGLGVNVAFLVIEGGYNYGFNELIESNTDSKPGQLFINLGFRF